MGLGNYTSGWDHVDDNDAGGADGGGGGMSDNERLYKFRFTIPSPGGSSRSPNLVNPGSPATKRVLCLDGMPLCLYEHSLYPFKGSYDTMGAFTAICLKKNELYREGCPLCAKTGGDSFPYFIGFFTIIDMGQVEYRNKEVVLHHETFVTKEGVEHSRAFQRKLLGAKRGSQEKPGTLKTLQFKLNQLRDRFDYEDLGGTVWDVTRTGDKAPVVGDVWEFVERVEPDDFVAYLVRHGANEDDLVLDIPVFTDENTMDGVFDVDPAVQYNKMSRLVGWTKDGAKDGVGRSAVAEGAGFGGAPSNDDIPF